MSKRKSTARRRGGLLPLLLVLLAALLYTQFLAPSAPADTPALPTDGALLVHVIDVGQGDAILLTAPGGNVLIDTGLDNAKSEEALRSYLDGLGIQSIDYLILTHVHADHIGGADVILSEYDVKNVIMTSQVTTTVVFQELLSALEKSDATVTEAAPNVLLSLGDLELQLLGPLKEYSATNNNSIVLRATFGNVSLLFSGDAEHTAEADLLAAYTPAQLQSDFFKAGHHGADTSSSAALLQAVDPRIVAISVGQGNTYGHPANETLQRLSDFGIEVFRTDLLGTLVFVCDGESIHYRE